MHRVLMLSPHFPPDTSAATHRVRLLAPHLSVYGWEPTVVTVDPRDYGSRLDPELLELVPKNVRVIHCRAWSVQWTRQVGIGDLGLRALWGLYTTCSQLLRNEQFSVVFISIYPSYPALLGPVLKRQFHVPFVLDYQDPWIGAWGKTVGGGPDGTPDWKSRVTRWMAQRLEPWTVKSVDAITAVSQATHEAVRLRNPRLKDTLCEELPVGGAAADFDYIRKHRRPNLYFDPEDGNFHLCYVGTLLPLGFETLRAVFRAVVTLRQQRPDLYTRLKFHFFGTSNQTIATAPQRVAPVARALGVEDCVTEIASRIDYLEALTVLTQATVILMMGSSEPHYTASKLYPGLLAQRPILAVFHEASSVVGILSGVRDLHRVRVVTYNDNDRAESRLREIYDGLVEQLSCPCRNVIPADVAELREFSANVLAGKLAAVFGRVIRS